MKIFKYISYLLITIVLFISLPINANAKTLGQLKQEYSDLESKYNENSNSIKATEAEISAAKSRVQSIYTELEEAEKEIQSINEEISKLNESIIEKDKEVKELMKFFQASQGESTYLEYIFSADSITDFIYRLSVTEQLSTYNEKLIDDMNAMVKQNNENIKKLHEKEDSLKSLQKELSEKLVVLAKERDNLYEEHLSVEEEIKAAKSILQYYEKAGCKDHQDISTCAQQQLPPGTKFWRPLKKGHVTSEYGYRWHPISGVWKLHTGIDLSGYDYNVMSITDGRVQKTGYGWNGGMGNYIIIHHNVNGRDYSSVYMHLSAIYVNQGDIVTKDTVIGHMGSTGSSTATHLHLTMYSGLYPVSSYSMVNPRDYINFPSYAQPGNIYPNFYNRTTYYD